MKKSVLLIYLLFLTLFGINEVKAQTIQVSSFPQTICLGAATITTATVNGLPNGVVVDSVFFDYDNNGTEEGRVDGRVTMDFQYFYTAYGVFTISVRAKLSNGTYVTGGTYSVTVIRPPVPDFDIVSFKTQCFRGNRIEVENKTTTLDSRIVSIKYLWDDGETDEIFNPTLGQRTSHSYQFSDTFEITMIIRDSAGCTYTLPVADTAIIKKNLLPKFEALGSRGCFRAPYVLHNLTTGIAFLQVKRYTWDFGDGTSDTRQIPWNLPIDEYNYDTITHVYTKPGSFFPALTIEDFTGCIDSVRLGASDNPPENLTFEFHIIPTITSKDTIPRGDSICFGDPHGSAVYFYHEPVVFVNAGDFLWNFGDPPSMQLNFNNKDWWPTHQYTGICEKEVSLTLLLSQVVPNCPDTTSKIKIRVLGPQTKIEDPNVPVVIDPSQKSQCVINKTVEFPNMSKYCFSEHIYRRWDFGDDVAPKCTSFLVPKPGFPPPGGWTYQSSPPLEQYNNSVGYFIQNGHTYVGKRIDCNYSYDTLPVHKYTDWDLVYQWYRDGHDYMPWDFTRYSRNPADTTGPNPKFWVADRDTGLWGKPVFLNPTTGDYTLTQLTYFDPVTGITQPYPRVDTIGQNEPVKLPQDLEPYNRISMNRGTPDPFELEKGNYFITPRGSIADPKNQPGGFTYRVNGQIITYPYNKKLSGQDADMDLYKYIFFREVQRCLNVTLLNVDSANNGSDFVATSTDFLLLDSADCQQDANVQLALVRPDARGLGKNGRECPGKFTPDQNGIRFHLDPTVYSNQFTGQTFQYPGINPSCGQTYILLNHDSLADRLDATPCALDGFVTWAGGSIPGGPLPGGFTPGGLFRPIFTNAPDWSNPMQFWQAPTGTSTWYHYGPGTVGNLPAPADPRGYVTVGLVVGAGDLGGQPLCISDTVWYHNFFFFREMDARFFLDPTYPAGVPTQGVCKEYCKNESILFVYQDSTQDSLGLSYINWGDNTYTLDSFMYENGRNDGFFVNGFRRVRYEMWLGPCGEFGVPVVRNVEVFPNGLPGVNVDTVWHENYKHRIYDAVNNPTGSLDTLGRNTNGDSLLINECGKQYWMALKDTLIYWYYPEVQDEAMMLMPIRHQYYTSSFEDGCKDNDVAPTPVFHILTSVKGCFATDAHGLVVRGVIDTAMSFNSDGDKDTIFCVGEPVHFYDSVRYWRPDCSLSDCQFNPNVNWGGDLAPLDPPYCAYHFDTTDYWRREENNTDIMRPQDGSFVEKMWWNFGDGDTTMGTSPIHTYKNPGRYVVTMRTRDRKGCLDTTWCYVYISDPVSKPVIKPGLFNCGEQATMYDNSFMTTGNNDLIDSIKNNYWWFGERKTADTLTRFDAFNDDTANWFYRKNGFFQVKLVVETYQGCTDTAFAQIYISGPRPKIKVLSDTIGCAPHKVRVVNISDTDGQPLLTKAVQVYWGLINQQSKIINLQYDTVEFIYYDSGTYYITSKGDDNAPMDDNAGCRIVNYPDTVDGFEAPIRIIVKRSYPAAIETNLQTVCVDQEFNIINNSDTISYTEFKYRIYTGDTITQIDTFVRDNKNNVITTSIDNVGKYLILLEPTKFAPGLPECKLYDTIAINVVKPEALFDIDSVTVAAPKFRFVNNSAGATEYTWVAYNLANPGTPYQGPVDKVQTDKDWEIDFGKDTGDFKICLTAYTADPKKPFCEDTICKIISYRFIVKMEIFNVFTPNADGKNDVFDIDIEGETDYDLVIFNRWGTKVFESKDSEKDWNGKNFNDGNDCPAGTYYYVFKYALRSGKSETLNGSITLIRQQ